MDQWNDQSFIGEDTPQYRSNSCFDEFWQQAYEHSNAVPTGDLTDLSEGTESFVVPYSPTEFASPDFSKMVSSYFEAHATTLIVAPVEEVVLEEVVEEAPTYPKNNKSDKDARWTDEELTMELTIFNQYIKGRYNPAEVALLKEARRRRQNRRYAADARQKRQQQQEQVDAEIAQAQAEFYNARDQQQRAVSLRAEAVYLDTQLRRYSK